ncbi:MAG: MoaD/ThiS family protein [Candidatus Hydrogenedentota bacterium]|nr:MAG: MoaD/ThiS family protein [Candidatus Hydrogenedentota bacterium]
MSSKVKIRVRYLGAFADAARAKRETCELAAPSVSSLIERLLERNGEKFRSLVIDPSTGTLRRGTTLLVNGHRRGLEHKLCDGDEVTLLTPVAGGNLG